MCFGVGSQVLWVSGFGCCFGVVGWFGWGFLRVLCGFSGFDRFAGYFGFLWGWYNIVFRRVDVSLGFADGFS